MNAVLVIGYFVELCGLIMTAVGLYRTWEEHADPQRKLRAQIGGRWNRIKNVVLRRKKIALGA